MGNTIKALFELAGADVTQGGQISGMADEARQ